MHIKVPTLGVYLTNTKYPGVHVAQFDNGTTKLYINSMLIVSCPCGQWYWKTPAYKSEHEHIVKWFMETYFPSTRLRKSQFAHSSDIMFIEPIKNREEVVV